MIATTITEENVLHKNMHGSGSTRGLAIGNAILATRLEAATLLRACDELEGGIAK